MTASGDIFDSTLTPVHGNDTGLLLPVSASGVESSIATQSPLPNKISIKRAPRMKQPKAPKDSKVYKTVMAIIALRAQGQTTKEIAETLQISVHTVKQYLFRAGKKGWLNLDSFEDPQDQLDVVLKSKVIRNVDEFLDGRDKEVTLKVFEHFKPAAGPELQQQPQAMILQVKVDLPQTLVQASTIQIRAGTVGGNLARGIPLDAEIIEA